MEDYVLRCGTGQRLDQDCEMKFNHEQKIQRTGLLNPWKSYHCLTHHENFLEHPDKIEIKVTWPDGEITETVEELHVR